MTRARLIPLCAALAIAAPLALSAATARPAPSPAPAAAPAAPAAAPAAPLFTPSPTPMACTAVNCGQAAVYANSLCHRGILECLDQFSCDPAHPCSFTYSCQPC